jgi:prepilin-type N-terminal cleavage/methylation domain-containing protein
MKRYHPQFGRSSRGGFTLLEVVIAAALSGLLMVAVYQAIDLHWKFSTTGRDEIERSQLARAILKKVEIDIRSVVFQPPEPETASQGQAADEGSAAGGTGSGGTGSGGTGSGGGTGGTGTGSGTGSSGTGSTEQTEAVVDATSLDTAFTKATVGIMGNRDSLLLTISRPSRGSVGLVQDDQHLAPPRSDLRSVMYFLGVPGAGGLAGQAGNALTGNRGGSALSADVQGLVRKEGDAMEMALADLVGDTSTLLLDSQLLAEEVNYLEFNYYGIGPGGLGWYDVWDSETYQMLPQAVRVTVGFHPNQGNTQVLSRTYRLVVHVPLSEPYPPEGTY